MMCDLQALCLCGLYNVFVTLCNVWHTESIHGHTKTVHGPHVARVPVFGPRANTWMHRQQEKIHS